MKKNCLIFITILLILSCSSIPNIHYYLIDYPLEMNTSKQAKYPYILGIEKFSTEPQYEEGRLVYRDSPFEIKFYNYHQWIISPKELIFKKSLEQIAASNLFKKVITYPNIGKIDYLLRGNVKAFEEWDEKETWYAHVKLQLELIDLKTNDVIIQKVVSNKTEVKDKKPVSVVEALGTSLKICIDDFLEDMSGLFISD